MLWSYVREKQIKSTGRIKGPKKLYSKCGNKYFTKCLHLKLYLYGLLEKALRCA